MVLTRHNLVEYITVVNFYYLATKKGASKYGDSMGYKSTVKMNFRGQDVENKNQFSNPNDPVSDEYIENL